MPDLQDTLRRLAGQFVARDIMTPLARLEKGRDPEEAQQKLEMHPQYDVIPIHQGDRLVAFLERGASKPRTIQIQHVVGAETSILDLVDSLCDRPFAFVVGRRQVIGLVNISDLNDPVVKLPYFVLLEGLERQVSDSVRALIDDGTLRSLITDIKRFEFLMNKKASIPKDAFRDWVPLLYFHEVLRAGVHFKALNLLPDQIDNLSTVRNRVSHAAGDEMVESHEDVRRLGRVRTLCVELLVRGATA